MKEKILFLIVSIFLVSFVSANSYSDCSVYGNCKTISQATTSDTNYSLVNVNNSQYLQGLTPQQVANLYVETDPKFIAENSTIARTGNCPSGQVVQNTTTGGVQCVTPSGGTTTSPIQNNGIVFINGSGSQVTNESLIWDATNKLLQVGAGSPIDLASSLILFKARAGILAQSTTYGQNAFFRFYTKDTNGVQAGGGVYYVPSTTAGASYMSFSGDDINNHLTVTQDGRIGIATITPTTGYKLDVNGDTRLGGAVKPTSDISFLGTTSRNIIGANNAAADLNLYSYQNLNFAAGAFTPLRISKASDPIYTTYTVGQNFNIGGASDADIGFFVDRTASTTFRARGSGANANPTIIRSLNGELIFYTDTAKTDVTSYTPTKRAAINSSGLIVEQNVNIVGNITSTLYKTGTFTGLTGNYTILKDADLVGLTKTYCSQRFIGGILVETSC